jgi:hypothetical protein
MDQCRLWKRPPPIIQHRHHPIKPPSQGVGLSKNPFLCHTLLSRLRAVPLTFKAGLPFRDFHWALAAKVLPGSEAFCGNLADSCWWMFQVWPYWWNRVDKRWSDGNEGHFQESTGTAMTMRIVRPPKPMEAWYHMEFGKKRAVQGPVRSPLSRTANCIAS